jgi:hypothetical protein
LVGRVPAQEKSGMTMTMAAMMLGRARNDVDYVKTVLLFSNQSVHGSSDSLVSTQLTRLLQ